MSSKHQIEALLRPAVEMYTALTALVLIVFLWKAPGMIFMTPSVANYSIALLSILMVVRFSQGWKIVKYKRNLKRLPFYSIKASDIPFSKKVLFLGKGFEWDQKHVQRLRDISLYGGKKFTRPSAPYRLVRAFELKIEKYKSLSRFFSFLSINSFLNPFRPLPPVGGQPEIHAVGMYEGERNIYMNLSERVGHTLVPGATRNGKTRLAENLIDQDIMRGDIVVVYDPKGDADLMKTTYLAAKRAGRKCYVFHLAYPDISARYNPVGQFSKVTEVPTRITDRASGEGSSAAFKMFAWRYVNIVAQALIFLGEIPDYKNINRNVLTMDDLFVRYAMQFFKVNEIKNYESKLEELSGKIDVKHLPPALRNREPKSIAIMKLYEEREDLQDTIFEGLLSAFRSERSYYDKIVSNLAPLLEQLTTGRTCELLAPNYFDTEDERDIFDWKSVIQQKAVVYVGLDCLTDSVVGGAVGASMFADLTSTFGYVYKHGLDYGLSEDVNFKKEDLRVSIHGDEFAELIGPSTVTMLNKGGGAGLQFTAYTQTGADIVVGMDSKDKAQQITGNFNNIIMLKVKTKETAQLVTDQLPEVQVSQLMTVTSARDSSNIENDTHFTSTNEDRLSTESVPLLAESQIMSLPKGQAFVLTEGRVSKIRIPMVEIDEELPSALEIMAADMKITYNNNKGSDEWFSGDKWNVVE